MAPLQQLRSRLAANQQWTRRWRVGYGRRTQPPSSLDHCFRKPGFSLGLLRPGKTRFFRSIDTARILCL